MDFNDFNSKKQNLKNQILNNSVFTSQNFGNNSFNAPIESFEQHGDMSGHTKERKVKKFFKFAIPVLILEVVIAAVLLIYLLVLPKNYCNISVNNKNAVVYVNGKETNKFRMQEPTAKELSYFYEVDISIKLPGEEDYNLVFTINSEKYVVTANTLATKKDSKYHMQVKGGEKTQLLSAMIIKTNKKVKDFHVDIKITATKI